MPLSVMTQKVPSGIFLMPEWPWSGWPLNGSETPVGRSKDLPITVPSASTRLPVVYLPEVLRSAGASTGASMKVAAGITTWPASLAGNSPSLCASAGLATRRIVATVLRKVARMCVSC